MVKEDLAGDSNELAEDAADSEAAAAAMKETEAAGKVDPSFSEAVSDFSTQTLEVAGAAALLQKEGSKLPELGRKLQDIHQKHASLFENVHQGGTDSAKVTAALHELAQHLGQVAEAADRHEEDEDEDEHADEDEGEEEENEEEKEEEK